MEFGYVKAVVPHAVAILMRAFRAKATPIGNLVVFVEMTTSTQFVTSWLIEVTCFQSSTKRFNVKRHRCIYFPGTGDVLECPKILSANIRGSTAGGPTNSSW